MTQEYGIGRYVSTGWALPVLYICAECKKAERGSIGTTGNSDSADIAPPGWGYRYVGRNGRLWACSEACREEVDRLDP